MEDSTQLSENGELVLTKSEGLFEQLCSRYSIPCQRMDTASLKAEQRPDYRIIMHSSRPAYAEVKQFDPSPAERRALEAGFEGEKVDWPAIRPGDRIRSAIDKAGPQLKALIDDGHPGILVVLNNVLTQRLHTDAYAVLTAMRGLDVVRVTIPPNPAASPIFSPAQPGPRKKMTSKDNRTISAVAVLYEAFGYGLCLDVFHNRHARIPLTSADLTGKTIRHFRMRDDESDWEQL